MSSHVRRSSLSGLYVILDANALRARSLVEALNEAAAGGARLFQYRDKAATARDAYRCAAELRRAAADAGALFLVNDRCDLALAVDADGVHLGQDDVPLPLARAIMGPDKVIGISTHTPAHVTDATDQGADYLGFGPVFPTGTKPDHESVVGMEGLAGIRQLTPLPVFAIGGVTLETAGAVMAAGADGVAVISAVWSSSDIPGTVRQFIACVRQNHRPILERSDR
ncbi:MAG: thiamine phosphate synthase [Nitrospiraceae bacterium]